jgi:hypothetical protein
MEGVFEYIAYWEGVYEGGYFWALRYGTKWMKIEVRFLISSPSFTTYKL